MEKSIVSVIALAAAYRKEASELCMKGQRAGEEIEKCMGCDWREANANPEVQRLYAAGMALAREADALTPQIIRANLEAFGLEDIIVTGVLCGEDRTTELVRAEMPLSEICGLKYCGLAKKLGVDQKVDLCVAILREGVEIGRVDSDGDFDYYGAPNLWSTLAWKIATDGGRTRLIKDFNLDLAAQLILDTIVKHGTSKAAFHGPYFETVRRTFVEGRTSRFGDGYCGAATVLWRVATRELGSEHRGYSFCY